MITRQLVKKSLSIFISLSLLLTMVLNVSIVQADESKRLLLNPSLEETESASAGWDQLGAANWSVWKPTGNPVVSISEDAAHTGNYGLKISSEENGRAAVSQDVSVIGGKTYQLSTWLKTEDIVSGQGARIRVVLYEGSQQLDLLYSNRLTGTHDWTQIKMDVKVPVHADSIRVQLFFETGTGVAMFDDVSLELINPAQSISIEQSEIVLKEQETALLNAIVDPADTSSSISWSSTNETVATVENGIVTGISVGEAMITVSTDNGLSASSHVKVTKNDNEEAPAIEGLDLNPKELNLESGEIRLLKANMTPKNADAETLVWRSSNEEVALIQNGFVEAVSAGTATITVETEDGRVKSESQITVQAVALDEYDQLRKRWENQITSLDYFDGSNERMAEVIKNKTKTAEAIWKSMVKNENRTYLWTEFASKDNSADIRANYRNITAMAHVFTNEHSSLYRNPALLEDMLSALEWLYQNQYNENIIQYSNWWNWEIGVPNELNNIMVLLYDYMDKETVHRYLSVVDHFQPDPTKSGATTPERYREAFGANRIDVSKVVGVRGVIVKDTDKIAAARDALSQTFENVTEGNGFYKDGSFVQHENIAYNGSYGIVLIEGLTELLELLSESTWDVKDPKVNNVYEWIENAYEPFMYKGALMDMVRGRAISRSFLQDHVAGHTIIKSVIRMAQFAPEPFAEKYEKMAKYWLQEDTFLDYLENAGNFRDMTLAKQLLDNPNVTARGDLDFHKTFAAMDRVVHRKPGYAFGISMYSSRIQNYEDMNDENRKGWYTGDGMTYLYNADLGQYSDDFWPTVDPYRMPGTTVDTTIRADGSGEHTSSETWVGGSTLNDRFGSTGMSYIGWNSSLTAKKSWFMFNDEIVALGTGITSGEERNIETIVENRKIRDDASNKLVINGEAPDLNNGTDQKLAAEWAHLEGNVQGADIGYYFPEGKTLTVKKEERTGAWKDINYTEPADPIKRAYATMWFDHGVKPENDTYSYVLLPGRSQEQTEEYAKQPDIQILRNDSAVQAVQEVKENMIGANFWNDEKQTVGPLTVYQKASVTMQETDGILDIAVSDPTMENEGRVIIEVAGEMSKVLEADENVKVKQVDGKIKLEINVDQAQGETFTTKLQMKDQSSEPIKSGIKIQANGHIDLPKNLELGKKLHIQSKWTSGKNNSLIGDASIHITPSGLQLDLKEASLVQLDEATAEIKAKARDKNGKVFEVILFMNISSAQLSTLILDDDGQVVLDIKDQAFRGSMKIK
ncbi:polysaccharide lyase family 8 super-sandwich domain-containing protein [Bacillus sp. FJAT-50079]|uniref:polysaccharide lyase family 8 super-sandwich domain-containing protein n=1 Tax=Bacillus sp. FJAT-50079 TaxID=2833577 RepID=UPI001BCA1945|nr:polysaccharide lyase family 8 super-sandwich domain-containing protein [Bacillus sp. FJAT-50079]MBS4206888.1 Ig-like domain-containing protein [Bacillus sp. FJAT-50079]